MSTILRVFDGHEIGLREADGYVNATAMCKAHGKMWGHYWSAKESKAIAQALATDIGIPISEVVQVRKGGKPHEQGTWVHPDLAINVAQWCNPAFGLLVSRWVRELLTKGRVELQPAAPVTLGPYSARIAALRGMGASLPPDHWCVFEETARYLVLMERVLTPAGLGMHCDDLLDGSVGIHWSRRRKELCRPPAGKFLYQFPKPSRRSQVLVEVNCYHDDELVDFRKWVKEVYFRGPFWSYLARKYPQQHHLVLEHVRREIPEALPGATA